MSVTIAAHEESRIRFPRFRPQLRLRTMLGAVAVLCLLLASQANRVHREQRAIRTLIAHGVDVVVASSAPDWLPDAFDGVWFEYAASVNADPSCSTPTLRKTLGRRSRSASISNIELFFILSDLRSNDAWTSPEGVPDELFPAIAALRDCKVLLLGHSPISDVQLAQLKNLSRLQYLDLRYSRISDRTVGELTRMRSLARLDLRGTLISNEGLDRLRRSLPECQISR